MTLMMVVKILYITLLMISYLTFAWSVIGVFSNVYHRKEPLSYKFLKFSVITVSIGSVVLFFQHFQNIQLLNCGVAFLMAAISYALFWSCVQANKNRKLTLIYSTDVPQYIQQQGPYKWIRHPFYTSYLISYFSVFVATLSPVALGFFIWMLALYYHAARKEESKFIVSEFGQQYLDYKKSTGMFFVAFWRRG